MSSQTPVYPHTTNVSVTDIYHRNVRPQHQPRLSAASTHCLVRGQSILTHHQHFRYKHLLLNSSRIFREGVLCCSLNDYLELVLKVLSRSDYDDGTDGIDCNDGTELFISAYNRSTVGELVNRSITCSGVHAAEHCSVPPTHNCTSCSLGCISTASNAQSRSNADTLAEYDSPQRKKGGAVGG